MLPPSPLHARSFGGFSTFCSNKKKLLFFHLQVRYLLLRKYCFSFGFCPISPPPPPPQPLPLIWTTCTTFLERKCAKKLGRGLPLPPHPQIDPIYTVCEKWTKYLGRALPLKSKRTVTVFREIFPNIQAIYPGRNIQETISRRQYPRDGIQVIIFSHNF